MYQGNYEVEVGEAENQRVRGGQTINSSMLAEISADHYNADHTQVTCIFQHLQADCVKPELFPALLDFHFIG